MKRTILGILLSVTVSVMLAGNGLAQMPDFQDKKPERPVEKPKDDKRNDPPKDEKRDGKKKPYEN